MTQNQISAIERVQKTALYLILDRHYVNYEVACTVTGLEPLELRREQLCLNWARKNLKSSDPLFIRPKQKRDPRRKADLVKEYFCRTQRYENSSLPYLAKLLNKNHKVWTMNYANYDTTMEEMSVNQWIMEAVVSRWFYLNIFVI